MAPPDGHRDTSSYILGWALLAVVNAWFIAGATEAQARLADRVAHHFFDAGQLLAMGLGVQGAALLWRRFGPRHPAATYAVVSVAAIVAGSWALGEDLDGLVEAFGVTVSPFASKLAAALASLAVPAALAMGLLLARPRLRWAGVGVGLIAAIGNNLVLPGDYGGVHFVVAAAAATLMGAALRGFRPQRRLGRRNRPSDDVLRFVVAVAAAFTLVVEPNPQVSLQMTRIDGAVIVPLLARLRSLEADPEEPDVDELAAEELAAGASAPSSAASANKAPPSDAEWFRSRRRAPDVPPSSPSLLPEKPLVLLITIDSVRAELMTKPDYAAKLGRLRQLAAESVEFRQARSPGSGTVVTFAQVFTGKHHFQLKWRAEKVSERVGKRRRLIRRDPSPRFTEIMQAAGVRNMTFASFPPLLPEAEILRGFDEAELVTQRKQDFALARPMVDAIMARLRRPIEEPTFLFAHLMDPHAPYDSAGLPSDFDGYVEEVRVCSDEIGRLVDFLVAEDLWKRTVLIVGADHGEGFSKHKGHAHHNKGLYEEIVRVPLFIRIPGVLPRVVETPVTLLDLGPTLLDLFGLPTPGTFMGQSLVPFLRGETPVLTRPLVSSTLFRANSLYEPPLKLIVDSRKNTVEIYDLESDPDERQNLATGPRHRLMRRLNKLRAVHKR